MNLVCTGINHKTATIDIRERFFLNETERRLLLSALRAEPGVAEALVLSTCNRTEVYAYVVDGSPDGLLAALLRSKGLPEETYTDCFYRYEGRQAANHFMRVCTGLDSIILGEKQILGQAKAAIDLARGSGMLGKFFNILSGLAVKAGKKAQNETLIGQGGVSVSWAAVEKARRMLITLEGKSVLIIGAGKMGYLAANHIKSKKAGEIIVMNRSDEKARSMAKRFGGTPVSFWDLKDVLKRVDVCICSAGAPHYLLEKSVVEQVMPARSGRRLVCVDISIPRNIEPSVAEVGNVRLITIDDLGGVVAENMEKRYSAVSQVEAIIARKIEQFYDKLSRIHRLEEEDNLTLPA